MTEGKSKIFRYTLLVFSLILIVFVIWEVLYRTTSHPNDTLRTLRSMVNEEKLIGKSLDECSNLFGGEIYNKPLSNNEKLIVYDAGRTYLLGFIGQEEYEYYQISVKCDEYDTIIDAKLSLRIVT